MSSPDLAGPAGPGGPAGPAGTAVPDIDTTLVSLTFFPFDTNFAAYTRGGTTWVRDPRSDAPWHSLDTVPNYPAGVVGVSLTEAVPLNALLVTVVTAEGGIRETTCRLTSGKPPVEPLWADQCDDFTQVTAPTTPSA
ncbi:hypothetical protein MTP10_38335 [Nonomuraea sp. 3-1Str]|uniref:hypothetical protein n=1 Tax=Nonomuraea sp. 3-1Str TaxID=2929801 RepID=UPI002859AE88|nr:hypothetical protein [Nonomuraea sp. 3-1Str]MDR8414573.1 hypothetical protein [Nonomuraea sp. 3-1Str]